MKKLSEHDPLILGWYAICAAGMGWVGSAEELRKRAEASSAVGVSEILYTPAGSNLAREARAFYKAVASLQG